MWRRYQRRNPTQHVHVVYEEEAGPIFTKLRRRKCNRRAFVCFKIGKVTLEQSALIMYSSWEVKFISDVFALLVSTIKHKSMQRLDLLYVHVYELNFSKYGSRYCFYLHLVQNMKP
jgi:hypothetical protein